MPLSHGTPAAHFTPHVPQFSASLVGSEHIPLHIVRHGGGPASGPGPLLLEELAAEDALLLVAVVEPLPLLVVAMALCVPPVAVVAALLEAIVEPPPPAAAPASVRLCTRSSQPAAATRNTTASASGDAFPRATRMSSRLTQRFVERNYLSSRASALLEFARQRLT
jgi:hypothetical protein